MHAQLTDSLFLLVSLFFLQFPGTKYVSFLFTSPDVISYYQHFRATSHNKTNKQTKLVRMGSLSLVGIRYLENNLDCCMILF